MRKEKSYNILLKKVKKILQKQNKKVEEIKGYFKMMKIVIICDFFIKNFFIILKRKN